MTTIDSEKVPAALLDSVVRWFQPEKVILFGSHARGEAGPDSDLDLLVVVPDDTPKERMDWRGIHASRRDYHEPVDIVPWPASAFYQRRGVVGSLPWTAEQEGVVVYERP